MGGFDLLALITPKIDHPQAVLLPLEQIVELRLCLAPARVGLGNGFRGNVAKAVEQYALLSLVETGEGFALRMNQGKFGGKLAEDRHGGGLVVDEDAALTSGENLAAQYDLGALGIDSVLFKNRLCSWRGFEDTRYHGLFGAVTHDLCGGLAPHQQRQGIYKDRLAGARFSREQVQSHTKCGDGVVDNRVVLGTQLDKHPLQPFV